MEFSQNLIAIIDDLCQKVGIVLDWSSENILPYLKTLVERFIKFEISTSIFYIVLSVFICLVVGIVAIASYKPAKEVDYDEDFVITWVFVISCVLTIVLSIAAIIVVGCQIYDIVQSIYLPEKLYMISLCFKK